MRHASIRFSDDRVRLASVAGAFLMAALAVSVIITVSRYDTALGSAKISPKLVVNKVLQRLKQGESADTEDSAADLLRFHPQFSARRFAEGHALRDPDKRRLFGDHLILAGSPE